MGKKIEVNLFKQVDKKKCLDGILTQYDDESITITYENSEITVPRKNISMVKTKYDWD